MPRYTLSINQFLRFWGTWCGWELVGHALLQSCCCLGRVWCCPVHVPAGSCPLRGRPLITATQLCSEGGGEPITLPPAFLQMVK